MNLFFFFFFNFTYFKAHLTVPRKPDNTTSSFDTYIRQIQRKQAETIAMMDAQLKTSKSSNDHVTAAMAIEKELLISKLRAAENKFYLMESLDDRSKYCAQKYGYSENLTSSSSVEQRLTSCVSYYSYSSGQNIRNTLNTYYNSHFVNTLNNCKKNNPHQSKNYTNCALEEVDNES